MYAAFCELSLILFYLEKYNFLCQTLILVLFSFFVASDDSDEAEDDWEDDDDEWGSP